MMRIGKIFTKLALVLMAAVFSGAAWAQDALDGLAVVGKPTPDAMGFQPAATEVARELQWLDGMLLVICTVIVLFVTGLLIYVILRFNKKSNPTPATFTHHSTIEVIWTIVPILILIVIGSFSLPVLFKQLEIPESDLTIKVTGNQWYWSYEYPEDEFGFDSFMLAKEDLADYGYQPDEYLLATDTSVVVPVGKIVRLQITGADVIHSWAIPAFGVKLDAVPGRLQETWFQADIEGVYFGQCSELCGKDHSYMPITVKVVSEEAYAAWLEGAIEEYASVPATVKVASAN